MLPRLASAAWLCCVVAATFAAPLPAVVPWGGGQARPGAVDAPKFLPVDAMLPLGPHMLISGGYQPASDAAAVHRLQLWDCRSMTSLRDFVCRCGAVTCLELLGNLHSSTPSSGGQTAMAVPEAAAAGRARSSSSSDTGDLGSGIGGSCRVLSGHAGGQVVLWQLQRGRGGATELRELAVLGEYSKGR